MHVVSFDHRQRDQMTIALTNEFSWVYTGHPPESGDIAALTKIPPPCRDVSLRLLRLDQPTRVLVQESVEQELPSIAVEVAERALVRVGEFSRASREIYLGGTSHMAELWEDLAKLHRVLALVERETSIIDLMQPALEGGTTVRLGHEIPAGEDDLAVVSKEFGGEAGGRVGLLGPIRMDYKRAIRVVEEVGEALDDSIGGS